MGLGELLLLGVMCAVPMGAVVGVVFLVRRIGRERRGDARPNLPPPG